MRIHSRIKRICAFGMAGAALILALALRSESLGVRPAVKAMGYETRLFDRTKVHSLDIVMEGWEDFLSVCENEQYVPCSVVIDGETWENVGLRAKGNTSMLTVRSLNSNRFSLKIEFDRYEKGETYYGLDKLCLNNSIQDNTYMKDYLTYRLMDEFGADAPLCSYVYVTVNHEIKYGLFLALEAVEDAFLRRNYGFNGGTLYKPDFMGAPGDLPPPPGGFPSEGMPSPPGGFPPNAMPSSPEDFPQGSAPPLSSGISSDVRLAYTDENPNSYANIFENAKVPVSASDRTRLIRSLKILHDMEQIETVVDVDKALRYFVVHNYVVNGDSYTGEMVHNYYLREKNGVLSMIPWDYNLAFGGYQERNPSGAVNDPIDSPLSVSGDGSRPMADWIFSIPKYKDDYRKYFKLFLEQVDILNIINETEKLIAPCVDDDPTAFCSVEEFQKGVNALRLFCELRTRSVQGQLDGSVPSTKQGQQANPSALINASSLNLSDMGSMWAPGAEPPGMQGNPFMEQTDGNSPSATAQPDGSLSQDIPHSASGADT